MKPDVSVIIPTRKRPELLAETIKSVRAQEGVTTEIIVVDDCPDSSAAPIAAAFEGVVYCRNPTVSQGRPAKVRNFGLTMATGELVHFLDDDDIVPRGHYAAVKNAFADRPDVGVVFGAIEPFGTNAIDVALCSAHDWVFLQSCFFGRSYLSAALQLFAVNASILLADLTLTYRYTKM